MRLQVVKIPDIYLHAKLMKRQTQVSRLHNIDGAVGKSGNALHPETLASRIKETAE